MDKFDEIAARAAVSWPDCFSDQGLGAHFASAFRAAAQAETCASCQSTNGAECPILDAARESAKEWRGHDHFACALYMGRSTP